MVSVVIGAGIVGLHVANALYEAGHEVFVLEREPYLAEHTSGRNSGVIHAGIFYKTGSFKEEICIEGNRLTYEWLERLRVPFVACGKWIVPEEGQEEGLELFFERVRRLPIRSPEIMSPDEVSSQEPALRKSRAIRIPSTGILDAASYVKSLSAYLEQKGVSILLNCRVLGVEADGRTLTTTRGEISFDLAVNCAGLFADEIAAVCGLRDIEIRPCRGDYYLLPKNVLRRPVYHLPYQGAQGLGVHLTPTVDGQVLVGPNAFFIKEKEGYDHRTPPESYEKAIRYFLPDVPTASLAPAYSGNRPKLFVSGEPVTEFEILKKDGWIHLLGIESPGLTSAPALARRVASLL